MSQPTEKRRTMTGVVVSTACAKTISVEVTRLFAHPMYGKRVRRDRKIHAHDEREVATVGDTVEIEECRPISATKRWRLLRVVERGEMAPTAEEVGAGQGETAGETS